MNPVQPYAFYLVVPLGLEVQEGLGAPVSQGKEIQVGHELQGYQVNRAHLDREKRM